MGIFICTWPQIRVPFNLTRAMQPRLADTAEVFSILCRPGTPPSQNFFRPSQRWVFAREEGVSRESAPWCCSQALCDQACHSHEIMFPERPNAYGNNIDNQPADTWCRCLTPWSQSSRSARSCSLSWNVWSSPRGRSCSAWHGSQTRVSPFLTTSLFSGPFHGFECDSRHTHWVLWHAIGRWECAVCC